MADTGKAQARGPCRPEDPDDEIVISGISGRFPNCRNLDKLKEGLMNKEDLITIDKKRWKIEHVEVPQRHGIIADTNRFDFLYFGMSYREAFYMDPMARMLLEHAYEAIVDAGVNPQTLQGTRTAVIIGVCYNETELKWMYATEAEHNMGICGCSKAMLANRISRWLGLRGPSYAVDTACSSSFFALSQAVDMIRRGECDSAIVGGSNLCLHPYISLHFYRLGVLSKDGRCKSFDENADGYVRSETISVIFLQKAKDAKRIYATVIHAKTNCDGFKQQGITYPSTDVQRMLLEEFYTECGLPPTVLSYLEAHATGTTVGDPEELDAISKVFCPGRTTPLKMGGVKSNLGHAEPASGLCSIAKVIIAMETGVIPPNVNLNQLRKGIECFEKGLVQVITEPTPWELGYAGVNSFGFGGGNAHVLLKSNPKEKINGGAAADGLPRLVTVSGRTEEAVLSLLNSVERASYDVEYIHLLHDLHAERMNGHDYRGYIIHPSTGSKNSNKDIAQPDEMDRPICFMFSGLGSQWPGMAKGLMRFKVFSEAIQKCNTVLKPYSIDLINSITNPDTKTLNNTVNSFVGIAAVQIGLVDLLRVMGIVPNYIVGHSLGELACAYADGCLTAEQMILSAYYTGLVCTEAKTSRGGMAEISLGHEDVKNMCPVDIDIACHNTPGNCTISGPVQSIKAAVAALQAKGISAKEIPSSSIAYHSRYVTSMRPTLLKHLRKVIPEPKTRSAKWLSTSVLQNERSLAGAKMSSAEYHTDSFLGAVLFQEAASLIPKSALMIEIAPQAVLQDILKRWFYSDETIVALCQRSGNNDEDYLLQALGKLYNAGLDFRVANLYPPIEFPVSRGTPMISPNIKWDHSESWVVTSYLTDKLATGDNMIEVDLSDETYEFMSGHTIDGRILLPAMGYLFIIWDTYSKMTEYFSDLLPVVFENVKFARATHIPKQGVVVLNSIIQKGTGEFEIVDGKTTVVTGRIRSLTNPSEEVIPSKFLPEITEKEVLTKKDFYKELRLRGYEYSGAFRGVNSASVTGSRGQLMWMRNWTTFMDSMLQIHLLGHDTRGLFVPTGIGKVIIDPRLQAKMLSELPDNKKVLPVYHYKDYKVIKSGGIEIRDLEASAISRRKPAGIPVLEEYAFVAHCDKKEVSLQEMVILLANIAFENHMTTNMKVIEVVDDDDTVTEEEIFSPMLAKTFDDLPVTQANISLVAKSGRFNDESLPSNIQILNKEQMPTDGSMHIACGYNLLSEKKTSSLSNLIPRLKKRGFLLSRECAVNSETASRLQYHNLDVIMEKKFGSETLLLLSKRDCLPDRIEVVHVSSENFGWLEKLQSIMTAVTDSEYTGDMRLILVGEGDPECGLLGLSNCLRREPGGEYVRTFMIQDENAPKFSLTEPLYAQQIELDMVVNILRSGHVWGTYRHLPLPPPLPKLVHHSFVSQTLRADLTSFRWLEGPLTQDLNSDHIVRVMYSAINFKDIMLATGKLPVEVVARDRMHLDSILGFEYSGVTADGRRVMGIVRNGGLSNQCVMEKHLTWEVPDRFTLEDAATIPCAYGTAYYALHIFGNLQKGERVLIHAGSGAVGQASINIALHEGCEVFTTVGTAEKRRFIRETFPSIDNDHIGNSRDTSFEQMVFRQTNGRGVDVVLNSLAGEKLHASVRCLAPGGRFLEIGKFDLAANTTIGMGPFLKEITYSGVMLDNLVFAPEERRYELSKYISDGLRNSVVKPLNRTCFGKGEVEAAFRYMAAAKHIGKVLIKMHDAGEDLKSPISAYPRFVCLRNRSYVIIGGLGGLGLEVTDWLILRGARVVILVSRGGIKNGYQQYRINTWKSYGVKVLVISGLDASTHEGCETILKTAEKEAPVDGIFNLAGLLKDNLCVKQTVKDFEESVRPKAWITKRLDEHTRKLCPKLRNFVIFSSVSCGRGTPGQTNYGWGNSVMERICERRAAEGLPAVAIEWGAVGEVGLIADMQEENQEVIVGGTLQQKLSSCLEELDKFLTQKKPIVSSMVVAEKRINSGRATTPLEAVLVIMGLPDVKGITVQTSLPELGMDSMMGVEIKQTLERDFEIFLTAQEIRNLTFLKIMQLTDDKLKQKNVERKKPMNDMHDIEESEYFIRMMGIAITNPEICIELPVGELKSDKEIFLVPGVDGNAAIFAGIVPQLNRPATCLQTGLYDADSIEALAEYFLPHILERSKHRKDFTIVGYSFGSLVAIELTRAMEARNFTGQLILVDGSPDSGKLLRQQFVQSDSLGDLQLRLIIGFANLMYPPLTKTIITDLIKCKTWEERLDKYLDLLPPGVLKMPLEQARTMGTVIYKRILLIQEYDVSELPLLQTPITLLKPTNLIFRDLEADYGLRKVTSSEVKVLAIKGDHVSMLESKDLVAVLNGDTIEGSDIAST